MRYRLDDLIVDTTVRSVLRLGEQVNVSGLNFDLLSFLLDKKTDVVSFEDLKKGVWAPAVVNDDTVTQRVLLLRNSLGDDGRNPRYIRSVRGRGYQLLGDPIPLKSPIIGWSCALFNGSWKLGACLASILIIACLGGWHFWDQGRFDQPKVAEVAHVEKRLLRAEYYLGIGQHDDNERAIALFEHVLSAEPNNHRAQIGLSNGYTAKMCRYNAARLFAKRAETLALGVIGVSPQNFNAHRALAYSYDCRGMVELAKASYQRAIELALGDDLKSQSSLAYLMGETGQLADALVLNLHVHQEDSTQTFSLLQTARVYELLGLDSLAEPLFSESFDLYPDNIFSNLSYPRHLFRKGEFDRARKLILQAKKRPTHPDLYVLSAELALIDNDVDLARQNLQMAVTTRPTVDYYRSLLERYSIDTALNVKVVEMLASLKQGGLPTNSFGWIHYAFLYQSSQEYREGIAALLKAVDLGYRDQRYLLVSPLFNELRATAGFDQVINRIEAAVEAELTAVQATNVKPSMVALKAARFN